MTRNSISRMITTTGTPSNQRMSGYMSRLLSYRVIIRVTLPAYLLSRRHRVLHDVWTYFTSISLISIHFLNGGRVSVREDRQIIAI
jgi:hypothetical protein